MMVNQYEVHAVAPDGSEGGLLAFAQQKRLAFEEQVIIYTGTSAPAAWRSPGTPASTAVSGRAGVRVRSAT
ncbi:hypothetical protein [Salinispora fenicalii]|uniref:hypothetical protein n=1 Tax=Salinispora fenicalii TaxID=1137263 RepID=UPI000481F4F9|nr:hypothetical protein [Salinispora fenicalii]